MLFHGIIPPLVTPMQGNEDLDLPRLSILIEHHLAAGVHGIFVLGTTGEFYALDTSEKQAVIAATVAQVQRRVPVFAGTGAETTREVIRLTQLAEKEGVDGVSVITPYYIMPNQSEIAEHYRRIAESTSLPVMLYSNPATCGGLRIAPETVARLAEIPNILGIKDSTGDLQALIETLRQVPSDFAVLQGRDTLIYPALEMGAHGAVPTTANLAARSYVDLYNAFQGGKKEQAKEMQFHLSPLRQSLTMGTTPGVLKAAMTLIGLPMGPSRAPLAPLSVAQEGQMKRVLEPLGLLAN